MIEIQKFFGEKPISIKKGRILKKTDETLIEALKTYEAVINNFASPLFITDVDGKLVFLSKACLNLIGHTSQENLRGKKCRDVFKADICLTKCPINESIKNKKSCNNRMAVVKKADGEKLYISVDASAIIDRDGEVIGAMEVIHDVTNEINIKKQVENEAEYAQSIIKGIKDPFFIVNKSMVVTYINESAAAAVGYSVEEITNKMTCEHVFQSNICRDHCAIKYAMNTGDSIEGVRVKIKNRNGQEIPVLASAAVITNAAGEVIGGFELVRDISALANIENEVKNFANNLLESSQTLAASSEETTVTAEQMSKGINYLAEDSSKLTELAVDTGKQAQYGGEAILKNLQGMNEIFDVVNEVNQSLSDIEQHSVKMGEIISVIDDVAEQTNLLALNAAIEAARAGEHGKGFAVVADEVRKLAERSAQSSKEIADLIYSSQKSISQTGDIVEESINKVETVKEGAHGARKNLEEIVTSINTLNEHFTNISASTEEISASAEQVSSASDNVARMADELVQVANGLNLAVENLGK